VSFNTPGCFSCHGQATPAIPAQPIPAGVGAFVLPAGTYVPGVPMQVGAQQAVIPAEPPHPTCTDPNARCPQIAFVHHVSQLGPSCTVCHQVAPGSPGGITVETNCLACHTPNGSVSMAGVSRPGHAVDTHRFVRDSCGRCHPEPVPAIHASAVGGSGRGDSGGGWGGGGGGWGGGGFSATPAGQTAACFFCHVNFPQVVAAGLQAGCSACSNCHDGGDGRGGDGRGGSSRR
jgi:hypothetical protein